MSDLLPPTTTKRGPKKQKEMKPWRWTEFEELKDKLTSPLILAYPDFQKPFELHTDASISGLGAVLYQEQDGMKRVVAYASRSLTKSEKNYSAYKLEFLALKWAITDKFSDNLAGNHFIVLTDNNPLTYVLTSAKLDATGQRWAAAIGEFDFDIFYRTGLKNGDADGLSRYPNKEELTEIPSTTVKAISCSITPEAYIETMSSMQLDIIAATECPGQPLDQLDLRE